MSEMGEEAPPGGSQPAPERARSRRGLIIGLLAGALAVVIVIAGLLFWRPWILTQAPTAAPSPSISPSASSTPTPTPVPESLEVSVTNLVLKNSAGEVMWAHLLTDDPALVVADLETAFGSAPVVTDLSSLERSTYLAEYRWENFVLISERPGWDAPDSLLRAYNVWARGAAQGPIAVSTPEGIAVGQPASVLVEYADDSSIITDTTSCYVIERDASSGFDDPDQGGLFTGRVLEACSDSATGLVSVFHAPGFLLFDF
nr:MAG: hypothetical protein GM42_2145 [actinobacterium acMicro-1]